MVDKSLGGAFFHAEEVDKGDSQTLDSTRSILDNVLNGSRHGGFTAFSGAMKHGRRLGGLDRLDFFHQQAADLLHENIESTVGESLKVHVFLCVVLGVVEGDSKTDDRDCGRQTKKKKGWQQQKKKEKMKKKVEKPTKTVKKKGPLRGR